MLINHTSLKKRLQIRKQLIVFGDLMMFSQLARPLVDKTLPKLEEACEVLKTLQANEVWGKVVLTLS
jgi:hypothetical protein